MYHKKASHTQNLTWYKYTHCTQCSTITLHLVSLSPQVLRLLEAMGMKEHQQKFAEHHINGDLLSECDEEILREELHVTKRLDRMRLLKVISGQYSVQELLLGRDGYVTMLPAK